MLDGWMHPVDTGLPPKVHQPMLMLNMESFQWRQNVDQMKALQETEGVDRTMITLRYLSLSLSAFPFF